MNNMKKGHEMGVLKKSALPFLLSAFVAANANAGSGYGTNADIDKNAVPPVTAETVVAEQKCENLDNAPLTPPEVLELSKQCDAVIYYGDDISEFQIQTTVGSLRNYEGYDVIAVKGLKFADKLIAFVGGTTHGGFFTEDDLAKGKVGSKIDQVLRPAGRVASLDY